MVRLNREIEVVRGGVDMDKGKLRLYVLTALIAGMAAIGGFIKVPLGTAQSAAIDSAPAFIAAVLLPAPYAGLSAMLGHFATAATSGFFLGPFHMLIAVEMFVIAYVFAKMHQAGMHKLKWGFALLANGILSPLPFYFLISPAFYLGAVPGLLLATALNLFVAALVMPIIAKAMVRNGAKTY